MPRPKGSKNRTTETAQTSTTPKQHEKEILIRYHIDSLLNLVGLANAAMTRTRRPRTQTANVSQMPAA